MREPRLPTGAPGTREGFLGISGFGDFSRMTSIFGAAGFSSGALISGTFGVGCVNNNTFQKLCTLDLYETCRFPFLLSKVKGAFHGNSCLLWAF